MMKKFLSFNPILFSYFLIIILVNSCSGSESVPEVDFSDTTCLLADRKDKDALVAVICQGDFLMGLITKNPPAGQDTQQLHFFIDSIDHATIPYSRTWDLSKGAQIKISHSEDYTLSLDNSTDGSIEMITYTTEPDTTDPDATYPDTAEYILNILTINSSINNTKDALRSVGITFSPILTLIGGDRKLTISGKLAVKTPQDFISMANVDIPYLISAYYKIPFILVNDLDLIVLGGKFDKSVIPVAEKAFDFDGGGHKIILKSAINTIDSKKPAAIIGEIKKATTFKNFTLDINAPISGSENVGTIVGYSSADITVFKDVKVNINSNLTVYKSSVNEKGYAGGLVGNGCVYINDVIVKTAKNVAIRAALKDHGRDSTTGDYELFHPNLGGLVGNVTCNEGSLIAIKNNVVDVTIGGYAAGNNAPNNILDIGGLVSTINNMPEISNNLVKLAIYKDGNLPADFIFAVVAGLARLGISLDEVTNNLFYVDFSNIGSVNYVGGLFGQIQDTVAANNIANNMVFIADGFTGSEVLSSFGAATPNYLITSSSFEGLNINNIFVSSPVTDDQYDTNAKLASFVHSANSDMTFNNLILDNTLSTVMFKAGNELTNLQGKVGGTNGGPLFTLAKAKTDDLTTIFSAGNTSWEAVSGGYPQLKAPSDLSGSLTKADIAAAWTETNDLIQTGLADRASQ